MGVSSGSRWLDVSLRLLRHVMLWVVLIGVVITGASMPAANGDDGWRGGPPVSAREHAGARRNALGAQSVALV